MGSVISYQLSVINAGFEQLRRCYPVGVSDRPETVPLSPPPPPEQVPKSVLRSLRRGLLIFTVAIVAIVGVFEVWRQGTLKFERDALAATVQKVDDAILHGKTPVAYYNAHATGRNGWAAYQSALDMMPAHTDRKDDPRLKVIVDWMNESASDDRALPDKETSKSWIAAMEPMAVALAEAASADVLVREYRDGSNWLDASIRVLPEMYAWKLASLRVELLFQVGRVADGERELGNLVRLSSLRAHPTSMIEGLVAFSQSAIATDLAVRISSRHRLSAETLGKLAASWPKAMALLAPMFEGELVWMCWMAESEPLVTSADGWFAWAPTQDNEDTSLTQERGIFVGVSLRRAIRTNMQHLQECLGKMLEGESLSALPAPHDALSPLAIDARPHALRVLKYEALLSLRRAAIELRLLEHEGPLGKQREQVETVARKFHGISVQFEGDDCVLTLVPAQFSGVEFDANERMIRLKPLP